MPEPLLTILDTGLPAFLSSAFLIDMQHCRAEPSAFNTAVCACPGTVVPVTMCRGRPRLQDLIFCRLAVLLSVELRHNKNEQFSFRQ